MKTKTILKSIKNINLLTRVLKNSKDKEINNVLNNTLVKALEEKETLINLLDSLKKRIYKEIIVQHYFNNLSFNKIAELYDYSERYIRKLHQNIIEDFNEKIQNKDI